MRSKSSGSVKVYYPKQNRDELIALLKERARALNSRLRLNRVVLFGSYAKKRQTAASDIDLLVVYEGQGSDAYTLCWDAFSLQQLELHLYPLSDYEEMLKSGNLLLRDAERDGVLIFPDSISRL